MVAKNDHNYCVGKNGAKGGFMFEFFSSLTHLQVGMITFVIASYLGMLAYVWRDHREQRQTTFEWAFGVFPLRTKLSKLGASEIASIQLAVDKTLRYWAHEYAKACEYEELARRRLVESEDMSDVAEAQSAIESLPILQSRVKFSKERFWGAHHFAKSFGFKVEKSFKSYLSK